MGRIARLLSFIRGERNNTKVSDAKVNYTGGANALADHMAPPGDDSHPLPGDYVALVEQPQSGRFAAVGYLDPRNEQTAAAGERRLYSRNADGQRVAQVWLKNDGTVLLENGNGHIRLQPDGSVNINGLVIDTNGNVTTASGISLDGHGHEPGTYNVNGTAVTGEAGEPT